MERCLPGSPKMWGVEKADGKELLERVMPKIEGKRE